MAARTGRRRFPPPAPAAPPVTFWGSEVATQSALPPTRSISPSAGSTPELTGQSVSSRSTPRELKPSPTVVVELKPSSLDTLGSELLDQERRQLLEWRERVFQQISVLEQGNYRFSEENSKLQARTGTLQTELNRSRRRTTDLELVVRQGIAETKAGRAASMENDDLRKQLGAYAVEINSLRQERDNLSADLAQTRTVVEELYDVRDKVGSETGEGSKLASDEVPVAAAASEDETTRDFQLEQTSSAAGDNQMRSREQELTQLVEDFQKAFAQLHDEYVEQTKSFGLFVQNVKAKQQKVQVDVQEAKTQWKVFDEDLAEQSKITCPQFEKAQADHIFKKERENIGRSAIMPASLEASIVAKEDIAMAKETHLRQWSTVVEIWAELLTQARLHTKTVQNASEEHVFRSDRKATAAIAQSQKHERDLAIIQKRVPEVTGSDSPAQSDAGSVAEDGHDTHPLSAAITPTRLRVHVLKLFPGSGCSTHDSYCVCEVPDRKDTRRTVDLTAVHTDNVWEIHDYVCGSSLSFKVYLKAQHESKSPEESAVARGEKLLGTATLSSSSSFPEAEVFDLQLTSGSGSDSHGNASLQLRVDMEKPLHFSSDLSGETPVHGLRSAIVPSALGFCNVASARSVASKPTQMGAGESIFGGSISSKSRATRSSTRTINRATLSIEEGRRRDMVCVVRAEVPKVWPLEELNLVMDGMVLEKITEKTGSREPRFVVLLPHEMELRWVKCTKPLDKPDEVYKEQAEEKEIIWKEGKPPVVVPERLVKRVKTQGGDAGTKLREDMCHQVQRPRRTSGWTGSRSLSPWSSRSSIGSLDLKEVLCIDFGVMNKACVLSGESPWQCFSLYTAKRSYDFVCHDQDVLQCWLLCISRLVPLASGAIRTRSDFLTKTAWCKVLWYCHAHDMSLVKAMLEAVSCARDPAAKSAKKTRLESSDKKGRKAHFAVKDSKKTRQSVHTVDAGSIRQGTSHF